MVGVVDIASLVSMFVVFRERGGERDGGWRKYGTDNACKVASVEITVARPNNQSVVTAVPRPPKLRTSQVKPSRHLTHNGLRVSQY